MDVFMILMIGAIVAFLVISSKKEDKRKAALKQARLDEIKKEADSALQGSTVNVNVSGGVNETLRMAQVKCVQCGASIEPGMKFCSHCGTQVPDDAFHAEISVNDPARLEAVRLQAKIDKARVANQKILAQAEAAKAKAEAKKIQAEERSIKLKKVSGYFLIGIGVILGVIGLIDTATYGIMFIPAALAFGYGIAEILTSRL